MSAMMDTLPFVLGFGFLLGLKHALEADHVVAVTTILSEERSLGRAALTGALWGVGHTAALCAVGVLVIALRVAIPERVAGWLEFSVALMIIFLGTRVLYLVLRRRSQVHVHTHAHEGGRVHTHLHFHEGEEAHDPRRAAHIHGGRAHRTLRLGWKPFLVGLVHGLAGSAALTLLVLTEIVRDGSHALGFAYLLIFGVGSIGGMILMSSLIGMPFVLAAGRFGRAALPIRLLAGLASVAFGLYYAWETAREALS